MDPFATRGSEYRHRDNNNGQDAQAAEEELHCQDLRSSGIRMNQDSGTCTTRPGGYQNMIAWHKTLLLDPHTGGGTSTMPYRQERCPELLQ